MNKKGKIAISGNLMGIVLIVLGIIIAGNVLDWWHVSIFFRGWWTLFIIVPCAGNVMRYGLHNTWGVGLVVGIMLLLSQWHIFSIGGMVKLAIPVLLILYGLRVMGTGVRFRRETAEHIPEGYADKIHCNAFFSGNNVNPSGEEFFGSNSTALFGGVELDLRASVIVEDVTIDATAIFGGIDIYLPADVNVKVVSTGIFGGTDNHIKRPVVTEWPTVYIRATAIFGGVEIQ